MAQASKKFSPRRGPNSEFIVGDHLVVELSSGEIFEGDYVAGNLNRLDLIHVTNKSTVNGASLSFYRNEIKRVYKCTDKTKKYTNELPSKNANNENDQHNSSVQRILMDEEDYNSLFTMCEEYIYMAVIDDRYYKACDVLLDSETVGVVALGIKEGRNSVFEILVLATWKQIYIFDLEFKKMKRFPIELKDIFESNCITKVIHSGAQLVDCLYRQFNISLENIFDTQIVDLIISKRENGECHKNMRNISECLEFYFNFPSSLLEDALGVTVEQWKKRPLSDQFKKYSAQLCCYLFSLYQHMQKRLLKDVYNCIDNVHRMYVSCNEYNLKKMLHNNECTKEIDELIPNFNKQITVNGVNSVNGEK